MLKQGPMFPSVHRSGHMDKTLMLGRSYPGLDLLLWAVTMASYQQCSLTGFYREIYTGYALYLLTDGHFLGRNTGSRPVCVTRGQAKIYDYS